MREAILLFPFSGKETESQPNRVNNLLKVTQWEERCEHKQQSDYRVLNMSNCTVRLEIFPIALSSKSKLLT